MPFYLITYQPKSYLQDEDLHTLFGQTYKWIKNNNFKIQNNVLHIP